MDKTCNCDEAGVELDVETGEYYCSACGSPCYENMERSSRPKPLATYQIKVTLRVAGWGKPTRPYGCELDDDLLDE